MNLFVFGERRETIGRYFRAEAVDPKEAIIKFDAAWPDFATATDAQLTAASLGDVAEMAGVSPDSFPGIISGALREWRVSPSRSFINLLRNVDLARPGHPMFANVLEQSRILASGLEINALPDARDGFMRAILKDDKKRLMVSQDACALTATDEGVAEINKLARALHLWERRNAARVRLGEIKLPKTLFRGIRSAHIKTPPVAHGTDDPYAVRSCRITAAQLDAMAAVPLAELSESSILSFTPTEAIAQFFTRDEGYVLEVDPADVQVIAAWSTDKALAGKDYVTGRQEREWIVRIPRDMVLDRDQVQINDRRWHVAMGLPDGVRTLHHETVATYDLEGHHVEARWVYKPSGVGGSLYFTIDDNWSQTRAAAKKSMGFDPLPEGDRLKAVTSLQFFEASFNGKRTPHARLDPADFLAEGSAAPRL